MTDNCGFEKQALQKPVSSQEEPKGEPDVCTDWSPNSRKIQKFLFKQISLNSVTFTFSQLFLLFERLLYTHMEKLIFHQSPSTLLSQYSHCFIILTGIPMSYVKSIFYHSFLLGGGGGCRCQRLQFYLQLFVFLKKTLMFTGQISFCPTTKMEILLSCLHTHWVMLIHCEHNNTIGRPPQQVRVNRNHFTAQNNQLELRSLQNSINPATPTDKTTLPSIENKSIGCWFCEVVVQIRISCPP